MSVDNLYWRAGVCKGFERAEVSNSHSAAFMDGYDFGLHLREQLEAGEYEIPKVVNSRSTEIRAILKENARLNRENALLRGANTSEWQ